VQLSLIQSFHLTNGSFPGFLVESDRSSQKLRTGAFDGSNMPQYFFTKLAGARWLCQTRLCQRWSFHLIEQPIEGICSSGPLAGLGYLLHRLEQVAARICHHGVSKAK